MMVTIQPTPNLSDSNSSACLLAYTAFECRAEECNSFLLKNGPVKRRLGRPHYSQNVTVVVMDLVEPMGDSFPDLMTMIKSRYNGTYFHQDCVGWQA